MVLLNRIVIALAFAIPLLAGDYLDNVAERARKALQASGLGGRAEAVGGDFFVDVPEGDVYLIKQILHDWNDDQCRTILADAFHISDH